MTTYHQWLTENNYDIDKVDCQGSVFGISCKDEIQNIWKTEYVRSVFKTSIKLLASAFEGANPSRYILVDR